MKTLVYQDRQSIIHQLDALSLSKSESIHNHSNFVSNTVSFYCEMYVALFTLIGVAVVISEQFFTS